ncbi:hypothetical protein F4778DRAFT_753302 [Xylariomycetidae sp. FL2044]|nr:hypothetical protein F4778DRAFT_753302 [Xylariomycetidae sp. FL2044]
MATACYNRQNNTVHDTTNWQYPCGNLNTTDTAVACCVSGDTCLAGGVCQYTHSLAGGSGYYAAGCTDKAFKDPNCRDICAGQGVPDVKYESSGIWACCGGPDYGQVHCDTPTDETFSLGDPADLPVYFSIPASGYIALSTSIPTSTSATATPAPTSEGLPAEQSTTQSATQPAEVTTSAAPASSGYSRLSAGAAAGVGVGVGIAGVGLIALLLWLFFRRSKDRKREDAGSSGSDLNSQQMEHSSPPTHHGWHAPPKTSPNPYSPATSPAESHGTTAYSQGSPAHPAEVPENQRPVELHTNWEPKELP